MLSYVIPWVGINKNERMSGFILFKKKKKKEKREKRKKRKGKREIYDEGFVGWMDEWMLNG